jgi:hypothetical protein
MVSSGHPPPPPHTHIHGNSTQNCLIDYNQANITALKFVCIFLVWLSCVPFKSHLLKRVNVFLLIFGWNLMKLDIY